MQVNNTPRFFRSFAIGLIASSAGAFVALPSVAMPEVSEAASATEVPQETLPSAVESLPKPAVGDNLLEENLLEDDLSIETAPTVEESADVMEVDADTVEAADIEALSDEAIEASDTMDGEPVNAVDADAESTDSADLTVEDEAETTDSMAEEDAAEASDPMAEEDTVEASDEMGEDTVEAETPASESESAEAEMNTEEYTIAELTGSSDSFEILAAALAAADLTETLGQEGPYTIFAPTDDAFEALPEGAVEQLLLPENKDVLIQILSYHVVPGALFSDSLETGDITSVEGSDIAVEVGDVVTVNNANVVVADVEASNGVIHIIDRVILPPAPTAGADTEDAGTVQ